MIGRDRVQAKQQRYFHYRTRRKKANIYNLMLPGGADIDLFVRRSTRAKRILLQVGPIDGPVVLVLPLGGELDEALEFAKLNTAWIERRLKLVLSRVPFIDGAEVPFQDILLRIKRVDEAGGTVRRCADKLLVPGHEDTVSDRVRRWYHDEAHREIVHRADMKAQQLGRQRGRITVRDQRTRWGSCSAVGNLNFSWRLIIAPEWVLDYVVAHEIAHLAEMNHEKRFWGHVRGLCAEPEASRAWLRSHGSSLYRFG